jgi:hypothetical protein
MAERTKDMSQAICIWCANQNREICIEECRGEGKYRHLEPEALEPGEMGPELPPMRKLVDQPPEERLAIVWLNAYYGDARNNGSNSQ